jgi:hypothetical protein
LPYTASIWKKDKGSLEMQKRNRLPWNDMKLDNQDKHIAWISSLKELGQ